MKQKDLIELVEGTLATIQQIGAIAEEALGGTASDEICGYYQGVIDQAALSAAALAHIKGILERSEIEV